MFVYWFQQSANVLWEDTASKQSFAKVYGGFKVNYSSWNDTKNYQSKKVLLFSFVTAMYHDFERDRNVFLSSALFTTSRKVANFHSYIFHSVEQSTAPWESCTKTKSHSGAWSPQGTGEPCPPRHRVMQLLSHHVPWSLNASARDISGRTGLQSHNPPFYEKLILVLENQPSCMTGGDLVIKSCGLVGNCLIYLSHKSEKYSEGYSISP